MMHILLALKFNSQYKYLEICPSRDLAGISRNFLVSRLLVWWKMLDDMVLKINLINFFVAKDESAEKIEDLFL